MTTSGHAFVSSACAWLLEDSDVLETLRGSLVPTVRLSSRQLSRSGEDRSLYAELPSFCALESRTTPAEWTISDRIDAVRSFRLSKKEQLRTKFDEVQRSLARGRALLAATSLGRGLRCIQERLGMVWNLLSGLFSAHLLSEAGEDWWAALLVLFMALPYLLLAFLHWPATKGRLSRSDAPLAISSFGPKARRKRRVLTVVFQALWLSLGPFWLLAVDLYLSVAHLVVEPRVPWVCHYATLRELVGSTVACAPQGLLCLYLWWYRASIFSPQNFQPEGSGLDRPDFLLLGGIGCLLEALRGRQYARWLARLQASGSSRVLMSTLQQAPYDYHDCHDYYQEQQAGSPRSSRGSHLNITNHGSSPTHDEERGRHSHNDNNNSNKCNDNSNNDDTTSLVGNTASGCSGQWLRLHAEAASAAAGLAPAGLLRAIWWQREVHCHWDLSQLSVRGWKSIVLAATEAAATLEVLVFPQTGFLDRLYQEAPASVDSALSSLIVNCRALRRLEFGGPWPRSSDEAARDSMSRAVQKLPFLQGVDLANHETMFNDFLARFAEVPTFLQAVWIGDFSLIRFFLGPNPVTAIASGQLETSEHWGGETALHLAARQGSVEVLRLLLLSEGCSGPWSPILKAEDLSGFQPLHRAAACGHAAAVEMLLLASAPPDVHNAGVIAFHDPISDLEIRAKVTQRRPLEDPFEGWGTHELEYTFGRTGREWAFLDERKGQLTCRSAGKEVPYACKGWTPLLQAAAVGHESCCKALLLRSASPDLSAASMQGISEWTPLLVAALQGHKKVCEVLVSRGASVNLPKEDGNTPLHIASQSGHAPICRFLCRSSADVDIIAADGPIGLTPLHRAARSGHWSVCEVLLKASAHVEGVGEPSSFFGPPSSSSSRPFGPPPLFLAAQQGHGPVVKVLLESRADMNASVSMDIIMKTTSSGSGSDDDGMQPEQSNGSKRSRDDGSDVVNIISLKKDSRVASGNGSFASRGSPSKTSSSLRHSPSPSTESQTRRRSPSKVTFDSRASPLLMTQSGSSAITPLYAAAQEGHCSVLALMIPSRTTLPAEASWGPLLIAAQKGAAEACDLLVDRRADVNVATTDGTTALYLASQQGHAKTCYALLEMRADPNLPRTGGSTALHAAVQRSHISVCQILLQAKAAVNAATTKGVTPLLMAVKRGDDACSNLLLKHGAVQSSERPAANFERSMEGGPAPPLLLAAARGHLEVCRNLILSHAEVNAICPSNQATPLSMALKENHGHVVDFLLAKKGDLSQAARLLAMSWGISPEQAWNEGWTPLHAAAREGNMLLCDLLLKRHADVNAKLRDGTLPIHLAAKNSRLDVAMHLITRRADVDMSICEALKAKGLDLDLQHCQLLALQTPSVQSTPLAASTPRGMPGEDGQKAIVL